MQVILDYHACVEYLCKYAAKGEPRSNTLKNAFRNVVGNLKANTNPLKAMKQIMIKTLGERDFSAQETMHLLLSLKLHSASFQVLPVNLDGTRSLKKRLKTQIVAAPMTPYWINIRSVKLLRMISHL